MWCVVGGTDSPCCPPSLAWTHCVPFAAFDFFHKFFESIAAVQGSVIVLDEVKGKRALNYVRIFSAAAASFLFAAVVPVFGVLAVVCASVVGCTSARHHGCFLRSQRPPPVVLSCLWLQSHCRDSQCPPGDCSQSFEKIFDHHCSIFSTVYFGSRIRSYLWSLRVPVDLLVMTNSPRSIRS